MKLCDNCLLTLAKNLDNRTKIILEYIALNGKSSKSEIIRNTELSVNYVDKGMCQLESLLLVGKIKEVGRKKLYWFTNNGARLISLLKKEDDNE